MYFNGEKLYCNDREITEQKASEQCAKDRKCVGGEYSSDPITKNYGEVITVKGQYTESYLGGHCE